MAVERAFLLLADIGGYTEFMRLHRLSLAHSQEITRRLLESMLDAVPSLRLVEVEGDALFLYLPEDDLPGSNGWFSLTLDMYAAFHGEQQWMKAHNLCVCDACRQIGTLRVKFVAHVGEVTTQTVRDRSKLVGVEVIAAHRMLKNTVPSDEYLLISEPLFELSEPALGDRAVRLDQDLEGLGTMPSYFVDFNEVALELPAVPTPGVRARVRETVAVGWAAFPRVIGLRRLDS